MEPQRPDETPDREERDAQARPSRAVGPAAVLPGARVRLRKPHACGSWLWDVVRVGADIRLHCCSCGRRVMLPRLEFQRRLANIEPLPAVDARDATEGEREGNRPAREQD